MATKKSSKSRASHKYVLSATGAKSLAERGGQAKLVYDAIKTTPHTAAELVAKLYKKFDSKEVARLNIAWYLTKWKAAKFVKVSK
jgi:hypothetical protein